LAVLWPKGVDSIDEVPADLMRAITHAFRILDWYENLMEEEQPPEWMWPFEDELEIWFEDVQRARADKHSGGGGSDDVAVPLMGNELATGRG
jgi:hypothetical protein